MAFVARATFSILHLIPSISSIWKKGVFNGIHFISPRLMYEGVSSRRARCLAAVRSPFPTRCQILLLKRKRVLWRKRLSYEMGTEATHHVYERAADCRAMRFIRYAFVGSLLTAITKDECR